MCVHAFWPHKAPAQKWNHRCNKIINATLLTPEVSSTKSTSKQAVNGFIDFPVQSHMVLHWPAIEPGSSFDLQAAFQHHSSSSLDYMQQWSSRQQQLSLQPLLSEIEVAQAGALCAHGPAEQTITILWHLWLLCHAGKSSMQIHTTPVPVFHVADIGLSSCVEQELLLEFIQLAAFNSADSCSKVFVTASVFRLQTVFP